MNIVQNQVKIVKDESLKLLGFSSSDRNQALEALAKTLIDQTELIINENKKDIEIAKNNNLSNALIDRLLLTKSSIQKISQSVINIKNQPEVIGDIFETHTRSDGLIIEKQRIPIGVIAMIFESRPNVIIDGLALAIKSGNALILKGGKEAAHSNRILFDLSMKAIENHLPSKTFCLLESRQDVTEILKLSQYIDLLVPRGGSNLVSFIKAHATMPVVAHDQGLCHLYLHHDAPKDWALNILLNGKIQRPGVCNALETLLIHQDFPFKDEIIQSLLDQNVEVFGCEKSQKLFPKIKLATTDHYQTEWLDLKMSLKIVTTFDEAVRHIQKYGSHHSEVICALDPQIIEAFLTKIDASCVMVNASSRFNDGGELGLGAELGISTSKLHAYGPMGAKEMTTSRFIVKGKGHIRL